MGLGRVIVLRKLTSRISVRREQRSNHRRSGKVTAPGDVSWTLPRLAGDSLKELKILVCEASAFVLGRYQSPGPFTHPSPLARLELDNVLDRPGKRRGI